MDDRVFTSQQVIRLAGISKRRLDYWIDKGIIAADIDRARGRGRVRLFSFANLVEIRTASWLRDKVSLQLIGRIVEKLRAEDAGKPLAELVFGVIEDSSGRGRPRHDVVVMGDDGVWEQWRTGQKVMEITVPLHEFARQLHQSAEVARHRSHRAGETERRRGALGSAEVVAGTRIPVTAIVNLHRAGYDIARIIDNYPGLTPRDVLAVLESDTSTPTEKVGTG